MNKNHRFVFALIAFVVSAVAHQASASPAAGMRVIGKAKSANRPLRILPDLSERVPADFARYRPMKLNEERWKTMLDVNYTVNTTITPMTDMEIYGVEERWAYPTTVGDCEDFVLLKRKMLMNKGFSASNLLITVVLQPNGEGHAVLTVRTDRGDFILDNMRNKVMNWSETEYTYLKRQDSANPGRW